MTRSAKVYPACAGIDPRGPCIVWLRACLPRMRGDRPKLKYYGERSGKFTPHARGSTRGELAGKEHALVYPACAGIDRYPPKVNLFESRLPRMRGDRPSVILLTERGYMFTPHARGSTLARVCLSLITLVYPACAGIDLHFFVLGHSLFGLPRMRGDRPSLPRLTRATAAFTPHARGSTRAFEKPEFYCVVYPACAGIDLSLTIPTCPGKCLPRMRGDRPYP